MEKDIHERYCDGKGEMVDDDDEEDIDSDDEEDINEDDDDVEDENRCTASWFDDYACISIYCFKIM